MKAETGAARELYDNYVKGTEPRALVENQTVLVGILTRTVRKRAEIEADKVYISSRALKKL
jgi:hypothetical protein